MPPFAGITNVNRIGWSVEQCAEYIARFAAFKRESVRILAAHMISAPEWELKAAFGLWLWEDAVHCRDLERRLRELRSHPSAVRKVLDYEVGDFLTELLHAPDSQPFCTGFFGVLGPAIVRAIEFYLANTQPLVDYPSVRLLQGILRDEVERRRMGEQFLRETGDADWRAHLESFMVKAGGVLGQEPIPANFKVFPRASEEYRIKREFARDSRFATTIPKDPPARFSGDKLRLMMWARSQEMTAAEMLASVIYEWEGLPTDGVVDLSRHLWDEVRHSLFGQAAFEAEQIPLESLPSWVGYALHTLPAPPVKRYAHLAIGFEAGAMAYPGGKRGEWEYCRDEAKHPLMTTFQDFDWADEVTHVNFGRKWIVEFYYKGDREAARKVADETMAERTSFYQTFNRRNAEEEGY